jgi:hypothetical protein
VSNKELSGDQNEQFEIAFSARADDRVSARHRFTFVCFGKKEFGKTGSRSYWHLRAEGKQASTEASFHKHSRQIKQESTKGKITND